MSISLSIVLACLSCVSYGRRLQNSLKGMRQYKTANRVHPISELLLQLHPNGELSAADRDRQFTTMVTTLASVPAAAFYASGMGVGVFRQHSSPVCQHTPLQDVQNHYGCCIPAILMGDGLTEKHDLEDVAEATDMWLAPLVSVRGLPGDGKIALGALELKSDGLFWLYGQIYEADADQWRPVILQRMGPTAWQGGGLSLEISIEDIAAVTMPTAEPGEFSKLAPSWPDDLLNTLEAWPLKGPGTVIVDPHFFVQRGAYMALYGSGPVLFPRAAEVMGLQTEVLIQRMREHIHNKNLRQVICSSQEGHSSFGEMLHSVPQSLVNGHFDLRRATNAESKDGYNDEAAKVQVLSITLHEKPVGLRCESKSWTCGAVVRGISPGSEVERAGCLAGDILCEINGRDVSHLPLDEIEEILNAPNPLNLVLGRPKLSDEIYLREAVAHDEAMEVFAGDGASVAALVQRIAEHFGAQDLHFSEQTPMVFAGDGGTSSHVHIDKKPLIQFCHILHGTKFFIVAPASDREAGPVNPWLSPSEGSSKETVLSTNIPLPPEAEAWMQTPNVSVAVVRPGDVLLFQGHSIHAGCNAVGNLCVALFHGAQSMIDMAKGLFGPAYQALALRYFNSRNGA